MKIRRGAGEKKSIPFKSKGKLPENPPWQFVDTSSNKAIQAAAPDNLRGGIIEGSAAWSTTDWKAADFPRIPID